MKYCKKCGAELADGAGFCEKCGNPVGQVSKQSGGKKKWIIAISSGVMILAVAVVGGLFATGVIGGKDDVVQTSTDTADIQETPSVTEEAVSQSEQKSQKSDADDGRNKAWEAFEAYKSCIEEQRKIYNEEYEEENKGSEDYEYDRDYYNDIHKFLLAYVDNDEYPELIVERGESVLWLYTYKNETVIEAVSVESAGYGGLSSYIERSGYMYITDGGSDWDEEEMYKLEGTKVRQIYSNMIMKDINTGQYTQELIGKDKILEQKGIAGGVWTPTATYDEESATWNGLWRETVDEAYTQLLSRNKEKENN